MLVNLSFPGFFKFIKISGNIFAICAVIARAVVRTLIGGGGGGGVYSYIRVMLD